MPPVLHHVGPLDRAVVERESLCRADQLAVHHPRREGIDLARREEGCDLVELRQPAHEVALEQREASERNPADHHRRGDAEPDAEIDGLRPLLAHRRHVAAHEALIRSHCRDQRVCRRLGQPHQQRLGAPQPGTHRCHQPGVDQQEHGEHRRGACGIDLVALTETEGIEGLPRRHRTVEVAVAVRRLGPQFQPRRGRACGPVRCSEIERTLPVASFGRGPRLPEGIGFAHHPTPFDRLAHENGRPPIARCRIVTRIVTPSGHPPAGRRHARRREDSP